MRKISFLFLSAVFALLMTACSQDPISEERLREILAEEQLTQERMKMFAREFVDALLSDPRYLQWVNEGQEELVTVMTNAMMEHPSMQLSPEDDCATSILMASVMVGAQTGEYQLPPASESERLCGWYAENISWESR